ncbi:MAG: hypothetical protein WCL50_19180 [Spirochaetota bacterium]
MKIHLCRTCGYFPFAPAANSAQALVSAPIAALLPSRTIGVFNKRGSAVRGSSMALTRWSRPFSFQRRPPRAGRA